MEIAYVGITNKKSKKNPKKPKKNKKAKTITYSLMWNDHVQYQTTCKKPSASM